MRSETYPLPEEITFAMMFIFSFEVYNIIKKMLDDGIIIILDRYIYSNMAFQGAKFEEKEKRSEMYKWIDDLEFNFLKLPKPNLTFFLHTPVNVIIKLLEKREEKPDGNETNKDYLIKAENSYFELCDLYNFRKIECTQKEQMRSIEEINTEILKIVKENVL